MNSKKLGFVAVDLDEFTDEKKLRAIARILETISIKDVHLLQRQVHSMLQNISRGDQ